MIYAHDIVFMFYLSTIGAQCNITYLQSCGTTSVSCAIQWACVEDAVGAQGGPNAKGSSCFFMLHSLFTNVATQRYFLPNKRCQHLSFPISKMKLHLKRCHWPARHSWWQGQRPNLSGMSLKYQSRLNTWPIAVLSLIQTLLTPFWMLKFYQGHVYINIFTTAPKPTE